MEKTHVSGVAKDKNVARLALWAWRTSPASPLRSSLCWPRRTSTWTSFSSPSAGMSSKDISFTVARGDAETAKAILEENKEAIGFQSVELNDQVAKVSIVGAGMANNAGVACKMFEALFSAGININMISTSEIKVSVLVDERDADRAVQAVHDRFFSEFGSGN